MTKYTKKKRKRKMLNILKSFFLLEAGIFLYFDLAVILIVIQFYLMRIFIKMFI